MLKVFRKKKMLKIPGQSTKAQKFFLPHNFPPPRLNNWHPNKKNLKKHEWESAAMTAAIHPQSSAGSSDT